MSLAFWLGLIPLLVKALIEILQLYHDHHKNGTGEPVKPVIHLEPLKSTVKHSLTTQKPAISTIKPNVEDSPKSSPKIQPTQKALEPPKQSTPTQTTQEIPKNDLAASCEALEKEENQIIDSPDFKRIEQGE